jgi:hypothetical protein
MPDLQCRWITSTCQPYQEHCSLEEGHGNCTQVKSTHSQKDTSLSSPQIPAGILQSKIDLLAFKVDPTSRAPSDLQQPATFSIKEFHLLLKGCRLPRTPEIRILTRTCLHVQIYHISLSCCHSMWQLHVLSKETTFALSANLRPVHKPMRHKARVAAYLAFLVLPRLNLASLGRTLMQP